MKISFDVLETNQNIDKNSTVRNTSVARKTSEATGYCVDLSEAPLETVTYESPKKTIEDVMQDAKSQSDVDLQKNYMAVMSNCMSDEDFAKLQKEGFHPGSTEIETIVTIVDQIKAVLAESGEQIEGYTDTLSSDVLKKITGSEGYANAIEQSLKQADVPLSEENMANAKKAVEKAQSLKEINENTKKYMIQNQMEPTIQNIYLASFSTAAASEKKSSTNVSDSTGSIYAKKTETYNMEQLTPQIEKIIKDTGLEVNKENKDQAEWLIKSGLPLNTETLSQLNKLNDITFPLDTEDVITDVGIAIGNGSKAEDASLSDENKSIYEQAQTLMKQINELPIEAADLVVKEEKTLNIKNLQLAGIQIAMEGKVTTTAQLQARRQLEEVRLQMTVEANIKLLKSGYSIETTELSKLVEDLKTQENQINQQLYQGSSIEDTTEKSTLYDTTRSILTEIPTMPASLIGKLVVDGDAYTLTDVYTQGTLQKNALEEASSAYETLMTTPRSDMGDSIKKAFQNVDDILTDLSLETTDSNRRAVRILGYNSMPLSEESILKVKTADQQITQVVDQMTPAATLKLIRQGINPLEESVTDLEKYLQQEENESINESEKYSKYLYKMEKNGEITEEEKESYIGIYRLLRQIEKSDGAVIGSVINQGAELSFKNLLSAVRSKKASNQNFSIDDNFGGLQTKEGSTKSISEQIQKAFYAENLTNEIYRTISPEGLKQVSITDTMTLEQTADALRKTEVDYASEKAYQESIRSEINNALKAEDTILKNLLEYNQPITIDHLQAANGLMKNRGQAFAKITKLSEAKEMAHSKADSEVSSSEGWAQAVESVQESLIDKDTANQAYQKLVSSADMILEDETSMSEVTAVDVKELALLHKQLSLATNFAKEENYEIPVNISGEMTSINLKIIHNQQEAGKVTATFATKEFGNVAAQFQYEEGQMNGLLATDEESGYKNLEGVTEELSRVLEDNNLKIGSIKVVLSKELDLQAYAGERKAEQDETISTKELYQTAKTFIQVLKGNK